MENNRKYRKVTRPHVPRPLKSCTKIKPSKRKIAHQRESPYMAVERSSNADYPKIWSELRANQQLCDGIIYSAERQAFHVHRAILSAASPYFKALFTNSLNGGHPENREVTLDNVPADLLELILDYAYTGDCHVTQRNVDRLLPVADQLEVLGAVNMCCEFLLHELRPENCLGVLKFARHYFCRDLESKVRKYVLHHFKLVLIRSPEFTDLSSEELEDILSDDELNARNEDLVFEAIKKWTEADSSSRVSSLPSLFRCVRFGLMNYKYFTNSVLPWSLIGNNQECQAALYQPSVFLAQLNSRENAEVDLNDPLARPRIPFEILFAIGGWSAGSPTSFVETYDTRADRWFLSVNTDLTARAYHGLVVLDNLIYMIGGFDGSEHFNTVRCYDPVNHVWSERACMYNARCYVSVCTLDGRIYALGGYNGRTRMNSAECYHPESNQWEMITPMNRQRSDASAASLNGKIYIAGGFNGQEVLSSAEVYDPVHCQWTYISPMRSARSGVSLIAYRNCLYALGGFNGFTRLDSGERYDPLRSPEWQEIAEMISPRSNFATAVLDDMIFVIGGFNGSTTIAYVECYDADTNEWYDASTMNLNRSALSACVLRALPNAREYSYLSKAQEIGQGQGLDQGEACCYKK